MAWLLDRGEKNLMCLKMADTVDTESRGNTRSRLWFFTLNNYEEDDIDRIIRSIGRAEYCIGKEVGESGTPHLQGCVKWENARRFNSVKEMIGERAHIEKCRGWMESVEYCMKEGDYVTNVEMEEEVDDPLRDKELYDWQKEIIDMIKEKADERSIYWYWEPDGATGKTTLAKHICLNNERALYVCGNARDVKSGIVLCKKKVDIVIWDLVRSCENGVSYQALEEVKNGIFFNTKYEPGMVIFNNPHVIVFANFEPITGALSNDRARVRRIVHSRNPACHPCGSMDSPG